MSAQPLVDELASALNSLLAGTITPEEAKATIGRYDLERDRTDLDHATLPIRTVVTIQQGMVTGVITNAPHGAEVAIIDYDVDDDEWHGEYMASIPQEGGGEALAQAFILIPTKDVARTAQLFRAVVTHDCPSNLAH